MSQDLARGELWGAICTSLHLHILGQKTALNEMHVSPFANVFAI